MVEIKPNEFKTKVANNNFLFPLIYDEGILFKKNSGEFYLYKQNEIFELSVYDISDNDKSVLLPQDANELSQLILTIDFIYSRAISSQLNKTGKKFLKILKKIKKQSAS